MPSSEKLLGMLKMLVNTRDNEIGCSDCYEEIDKFVEMLLSGKKADEALPMVQHHLEMCSCCHEEFEALLEAIQQADNP
jgi:deoxycytidylate deaminase